VTTRTRRFPTKPSRRSVRNMLAFMGGETEIEQAPSRKTGTQKETSVVKSVQSMWATLKRGVLYRNRRGMVQLSSGAMMPIGLGPNGTGDLVGYTLVVITPAMLNKTVPIYTELEGKTEAGRLAPHQLARIEELRDVNAIAGCVRSQEDADAVYQRWLQRAQGDER